MERTRRFLRTRLAVESYVLTFDDLMQYGARAVNRYRSSESQRIHLVYHTDKCPLTALSTDIYSTRTQHRRHNRSETTERPGSVSPGQAEKRDCSQSAVAFSCEPSAPPMVPLSRTSVWLASRSSFARWSRAECSSESRVCMDLYKFILELARTPVFGSRQRKRET
jgi:hypothetical protein